MEPFPIASFQSNTLANNEQGTRNTVPIDRTMAAPGKKPVTNASQYLSAREDPPIKLDAHCQNFHTTTNEHAIDWVVFHEGYGNDRCYLVCWYE